MTIDFSTPVGLRATRRLATERVIWLTTISPSGAPVPSPVWFLWSEDQVLVASQPAKPKVCNVNARPRVALQFNTDAHGGDVQILSGEAVEDPDGLSALERTAYDAKYRSGLASLGMTSQTFHDDYSVIIRIHPDRLRGF